METGATFQVLIAGSPPAEPDLDPQAVAAAALLPDQHLPVLRLQVPQLRVLAPWLRGLRSLPSKEPAGRAADSAGGGSRSV